MANYSGLKGVYLLVKTKRHKEQRFTVKLDERTFITVRNMVKVKYWLRKYPDAKVVG